MMLPMRACALICVLCGAGVVLAQQSAVPTNPPPPTLTAPVAVGPTNWTLRVIRAERLRTMLQHTNDFVLVDVSPRFFYQDFHIRGAMSVPEDELAQTVRDWPRQRRLVVYCLDKECESGRDAVHQLLLMGFADVILYEGGKREWHAKKYEAVGHGKLLDD
jgi:rhodanese-related sulfurtransferase